MAHKVLSSDMAELINAMKMAQQYSSTLLDSEYRKGMLKAAHVLAMDSKNLLDAVDSVRKRLLAARKADEEGVVVSEVENGTSQGGVHTDCLLPEDEIRQVDRVLQSGDGEETNSTSNGCIPNTSDC